MYQEFMWVVLSSVNTAHKPSHRSPPPPPKKKFQYYNKNYYNNKLKNKHR